MARTGDPTSQKSWAAVEPVRTMLIEAFKGEV